MWTFLTEHLYCPGVLFLFHFILQCRVTLTFENPWLRFHFIAFIVFYGRISCKIIQGLQVLSLATVVVYEDIMKEVSRE